MLEVDLGHYSRKRILEKVEALTHISEARYLLIACPTVARQLSISRTLKDRYGPDIWERVDVLTFEDLQNGKAPNDDPGLLPAARTDLLHRFA